MDSRAEFQRTTLDLRPREGAGSNGTTEKTTITRRPFDIEHVFTPRGAAYDFNWDGSRAYLAWHDVLLSDGEMNGDSFRTIRTRDLRRRMVFFPDGTRASGWCSMTERPNSFAALYFDQAWLFEQMEVPERDRALHPLIHFHDRALLSTMEKIGRIARARSVAPRMELDSLVLLAGAELLRTLGTTRKEAGSLSRIQLDRAKDYILAHLAEDVALADIAAAAELSPHHFVRAFKQSEGVTPYRYLLERRIDRAKQLIDSDAMPIGAVAQLTGFKSASHFSRTFADIAGVSPRAYRAMRRP